MDRCDACGKYIPREDFGEGAIRSIPDQPETDTLCKKCNGRGQDANRSNSDM